VYANPTQIPPPATSLKEVVASSLGTSARTDIVTTLLETLHSEEFQAYHSQPQSILKEFWQASRLTQIHSYQYHAYSYEIQGRLYRLYPDGTAEIQTESGELVHLMA
jgi:hypothetical protein